MKKLSFSDSCILLPSSLPPSLLNKKCQVTGGQGTSARRKEQAKTVNVKYHVLNVLIVIVHVQTGFGSSKKSDILYPNVNCNIRVSADGN